MAIIQTCDGCLEPIDEPVKSGQVIIRDYCPCCAEKAEDFLKNEGELRQRLAEQFMSDRNALIAKYSEGNFKLPDMP